jgi:hypothetical protein
MDIAITASKVIDRAILLEEGGAIVIPCSSYEEMEKLRTRLYKIRRQLKSQHRELSSSIDITRKVRENKWTLYITKDTGLSGVFIVEDGEAKPFTLEEQTPEQVPEEPLEQAPEDFDEVAAKIEEAQDLQEENEETSKNNIS